MWSTCLRAEYFCGFFQQALQSDTLLLVPEAFTNVGVLYCAYWPKFGGLYPIKQITGCTIVSVRQCYCVSTVRASGISGLAHEQKLVIELSREETEERNKAKYVCCTRKLH